MKYSMVKKYDALQGRPIREIKANDIVHISAKYAGFTAAGTLAFYACSSTMEVYITGLGFSASAAGDQIAVTVNTATILPQRASAAGITNLTTDREAPFYKAPASSTISIAAVATGSMAAWLCGVKEPPFAYVETV